MPPGTSGAIGFTFAPCAIWVKFCNTSDMPIALISGASRNEPRNGRYATRSIVQPYSPAMAAANTSVSTSAIGTDVMPKTNASSSSEMSERKAPTMNTSPWAKLIMPMMP